MKVQGDARFPRMREYDWGRAIAVPRGCGSSLLYNNINSVGVAISVQSIA